MENDLSRDLVTQWRAGDQQAAEQLFHRYAGRLVALVRSKLSSKLAQRIDPEDVVQSVYRSFFADTRDGHYDFQRGGDLWNLLVAISLHKLSNQVRRQHRAKRAAEGDEHFGSEDSLFGLHAQALAREPSPVDVVMLADELEQFLHRLNPARRRVLELRLQGYTLEEIAIECACCRRTVIRNLEWIKEQLRSWQPPQPHSR
jgi:RNA polymerase sigma-70 factor (ECF subfamily)